MSLLILMRHGQSEWNKRNLFTGWVDVPLSNEGIQESLHGGRQIRDLLIDVVITTTLVRAQTTALLALSQHSSRRVPVVLHNGEGKLSDWSTIYGSSLHTIPMLRCWELNERMYGELQGLNKAETAEKFGQQQVHRWRRSYDEAPPGGESLAMTAARALPYFHNTIVPLLTQEKNVFVCAHGNSLRCILMELDQLNREQVVSLEIFTGQPLVYDYKGGVFRKKDAWPSSLSI